MTGRMPPPPSPMTDDRTDIILDVRNLVKHFELVGESGCGKTTTGRCVLQLERPTSGQVIFEGRDLTTLSESELRRARRRIQVIFQDPYSSLNPRMTVGQMLAEPLAVHGIVADRSARAARVQELL